VGALIAAGRKGLKMASAAAERGDDLSEGSAFLGSKMS